MIPGGIGEDCGTGYWGVKFVLGFGLLREK